MPACDACAFLALLATIAPAPAVRDFIVLNPATRLTLAPKNLGRFALALRCGRLTFAGAARMRGLISPAGKVLPSRGRLRAHWLWSGFLVKQAACLRSP
jgi:hypothetical protein